MSTLHIPSQKDTPEIIADGETGRFSISGKSLPEDAIEFFQPLEDYVREYLQHPKNHTVLNLKLIYLNSSSSKKLLDILSLFDKLRRNHFQVEVNWITTAGDHDIYEEGVELTHMTSIPFNFITEND